MCFTYIFLMKSVVLLSYFLVSFVTKPNFLSRSNHTLNIVMQLIILSVKFLSITFNQIVIEVSNFSLHFSTRVFFQWKFYYWRRVKLRELMLNHCSGTQPCPLVYLEKVGSSKKVNFWKNSLYSVLKVIPLMLR